MACGVQSEVTKKIDPLPRPNHHARLLDQLHRILVEPDAAVVGTDIVDAVLKLIASTERRALEAKLSQLPDLTNEAEAA